VNKPAHQVVDPTRDTDEAALLARARGGDAEAVDALVRKYLPDVYAVTYRVLGDRDLAQDAAQDALVNALRGLERFRGEASLRTWLMRIATNAARTMARRRTKRREVALDAAAGNAADAPDPAVALGQRADAERVAAMLGRLPHKQRLAVTLRTQQGLSYQQIGVVLECSEGAARVNYHLGVKRLRELMK